MYFYLVDNPMSRQKKRMLRKSPRGQDSENGTNEMTTKANQKRILSHRSKSQGLHGDIIIYQLPSIHLSLTPFLSSAIIEWYFHAKNWFLLQNVIRNYFESSAQHCCRIKLFQPQNDGNPKITSKSYELLGRRHIRHKFENSSEKI